MSHKQVVGFLIIIDINSVIELDLALKANAEMDSHNRTVAAFLDESIGLQCFQRFFLRVLFAGVGIDVGENASNQTKALKSLSQMKF